MSPYPHSPQVRGQLSPAKRALVLQVETGADDDEWVSSESGAVTPADYEEEDAPPSPQQPAHSEDPEPLPPSTTPRGDLHTLPPRMHHPSSHADLPRVDTVTKFTIQAEDSPSSDSVSHDPLTPTRRMAQAQTQRRPSTRPPSLRSAHSAQPHPLIRARSYAPSTPIITAPPTLSSSIAQVYLGSHASSPIGSPQQDLPPEMVVRSPLSETHHAAYLPRLKRQGSQSSMASVATLPLPTTSSTATAHTTRVHGERQRTLSHASISAALTSLTAARNPHLPSRPPSPALPIAFPPINPHGDYAHVMIPLPLVPPHVSATAHQNPIVEAWQRVSKAKADAGR